jgi:succinate-acetate transporter protein
MVFLTLWPTYALLGLGKALDSNLLFHIGGAFGIATAACAWYASFAITANRTTQRDWLPLGDMRSVQQDAGNGALNRPRTRSPERSTP